MERQKTPTLINLPPPDPYTPSDIPGTPNSTQTSLSAISTTAIKDGHTGQHGASHRHHHHHSSSNASGSSTNTLDAERADRISRLAGLERVATVRQPSSSRDTNAQATNPTVPFNSASSISPNIQLPTQAQAQAQASAQQQTIGYFDASGNPRLAAARSTVGSASATGSMAGRTTWASGSTTTENASEHDHEHGEEQGQYADADADEGRSMSHMSMADTNMSATGYDPDKMSDVDAVSSAGLSDGGQESLVGFGEGANSTVSGPISAPRDPMQMARLRAAARMGNAGAIVGQGSMTGVERTGPLPGSSQSGFGSQPDGMEGVETAERIVRERLGQPEGGIQSPTDGKLGKFPFEER